MDRSYCQLDVWVLSMLTIEIKTNMVKMDAGVLVANELHDLSSLSPHVFASGLYPSGFCPGFMIQCSVTGRASLFGRLIVYNICW